jgi:Lon protease-like protein
MRSVVFGWHRAAPDHPHSLPRDGPSKPPRGGRGAQLEPTATSNESKINLFQFYEVSLSRPGCIPVSAADTVASRTEGNAEAKSEQIRFVGLILHYIMRYSAPSLLALSLSCASALVVSPVPSHGTTAATMLCPRCAASPIATESAVMDIRWAPSIDPTAADVEPSEGATVMPLFPLGVTYLPFTSQTLNIFEPRYRQMFNDILMNGARRFMVCNVDQETGRLAETGVIFYLDELKEVSEQTQDRVKFVGSHSVVGRVQLKKVLNPSAAASRETYLRAEVVELEDSDADAELEEKEQGCLKMFKELVDTQSDIGEEPRFTEARAASPCRSSPDPPAVPAPLSTPPSVGSVSCLIDDHPPNTTPLPHHPSLPPTQRVKGLLNFERGTSEDEKGVWGTALLWQQFLEQRMTVVANRMQKEIQQEVMAYLKTNSIDSDKVNSRGEMRLEDLPAPLIADIRNIQRRYREELEGSENDPTGLQFQALLQSRSHAERLDVFEHIVETEGKRLAARATLKAMFKSTDEGSE